MSKKRPRTYVDIERSLANLARYQNLPGLEGFMLERSDREFLEGTMNEAIAALGPIVERHCLEHAPSAVALLMLGQNLNFFLVESTVHSAEPPMSPQQVVGFFQTATTTFVVGATERARHIIREREG